MSAVLLGLVAAFAWGVNDLLIRIVSRTLGSLQSTLLILIFGALALCATMFIRGESPLVPAGNFWILSLSGVSYALAVVCLF
jgi:drug/metabolite transporter (DMT)-like permease